MIRYKIKDSVNIAAEKRQRKAYLKNGIALLVTVLICGGVTYRLLNSRITERYNDFTIDTAVEWLENADREKFGACRENITDADDWFGLFMSDRKSMGKIQARTFISRRNLPDAGIELKCYELKFISNFSGSPQDVYERLIVESDNHSRFTVINASYWLSFQPGRTGMRLLTENEKQYIANIAEDVLKKVYAGETAFFKHAYAELAKQPDYFHSSKWLAAEAKTGRTIAGLYNVLSNGKPSPFKFENLELFAPAGRTGFECSRVYYSFSAEKEGKSRNFMLFIAIDRDLYQNKSAEWKFFGIWFWENKENKK